jgi:hypothetical protein
MLRPVLLALLLLALNGPSAAQGLKLQREAETPLRARVHLLSGDEYGQGTRLLGAQLLGDYFLGSRGLRVSGGLMLGPDSLLASGMTPTQPGRLGVAQRRLLGGLLSEGSSNQPYLGMGISRHGGDWAFSADLGVAVNGSPSGLRLGSASAFANSLDESLRRLQWTPVLQLGLSYRF